MIARNLESSRVIVLRVNVGHAALGYLYGFADKERFYLYQCGFDYDLVERNSMPGLVCHVLAMQTLADRGLKMYDFMAGSSGYKSALSNFEESMTWTLFRSDSVRFNMVERVQPFLSTMRRIRRQLVSALECVRPGASLPNPAGGALNQGA
jgi:CelD/BcsL family acetyltransferase involved in cellulose biosynthesis